jgi:hypothetical protein
MEVARSRSIVSTNPTFTAYALGAGSGELYTSISKQYWLGGRL